MIVVRFRAAQPTSSQGDLHRVVRTTSSMYRGLRPNVMDICAARRREAHIDCLLVLEQSQESGPTFVGPLFLRRASRRRGPLIPHGFASRSGEMGDQVKPRRTGDEVSHVGPCSFHSGRWSCHGASYCGVPCVFNGVSRPSEWVLLPLNPRIVGWISLFTG